MDKLTPKDGQSKDLLADNIEQLKQLFPEVITEGPNGQSIDFDHLRRLLGDAVETEPERYAFTWHGKTQAKLLAQQPSTGTLRPRKDQSVNWDSTQNLFIEGDNLEVLKLLQKPYHKRVKMIYIDPPYNTGKEFIYPDKFADNLDTYLHYTGQKDGDGKAWGTNTETSGRYHTNWLNMMYPRLKLARNLLENDGCIVVSISDHEVANLKLAMNDVFGEENFVSQIVWQRSKRGGAKLIANLHEYMLIYTRDKAAAIESGKWRVRKEGAGDVLAKYAELRRELGDDHDAIRQAMGDWYASLDDDDVRLNHKHYRWSDGRGLYFPDNFAGPDDGRKNRPRHDIIHPVTKNPCKKPSTGWRWDQAKTDWALEQSPPRIHFGEDESTIPNRKSYLAEIKDEPHPSVIYADGRSATLEVESLVGEGVFPFPKNKEVIARLISMLCGENDIVMDFFAGSGSTAHAVASLNDSQGKQLRWLLVQLPETVDDDHPARKFGFKSIAGVARRRIQQAQDRVDKNNQSAATKGFRAYQLADSNLLPWTGNPDDLETAIQPIKQGRSKLDVLFEIMLKYGLDLSLAIDERTVAGATVYNLGAGALLVCLADAISLDVVEGIAALKDELDPATCRVVFKDAGFADDVVKTNAVQILKRHGIEDVKSL